MVMKAFCEDKMFGSLLKEYESGDDMVRIFGCSGRSVENRLEGVKTGSRRMTLAAFDVPGVIRQW